MARSRIIKPGFFTNDILAEVPLAGRLLFAGLWTIADREGRLEERPKRIKAEILPYDDCDIGALLAALAQHGFIMRYTVKGVAYIQVTGWKHQSPHVNEAQSVIPAPEEHDTSTVQVPEQSDLSITDSIYTSNSTSIDTSVVEPAQAPAKRKTRAPESYEVDETAVEFATKAGFRGDRPHLEFVTASFLDHHAAKGTTSLDWRKTWQTWIRRSVTYGEDLPNKGRQTGGNGQEAPAITVIKKGSISDPEVRAKYEKGGKYGNLFVVSDQP